MEDQKVIDVLEPVQPCSHMKGLLSRLADGTLNGVLLWYTKYHTSHCPDCNKTVHALMNLVGRLGGLRPAVKEELPADRWQEIENQWKVAEEASPKH